jgi:hypothetical protein
MKDRKVKQVLYREEYKFWGGGKQKGERGRRLRSTLYMCVKIEQLELPQLFQEGGERE